VPIVMGIQSTSGTRVAWMPSSLMVSTNELIAAADKAGPTGGDQMMMALAMFRGIAKVKRGIYGPSGADRTISFAEHIYDSVADTLIAGIDSQAAMYGNYQYLESGGAGAHIPDSQGLERSLGISDLVERNINRDSHEATQGQRAAIATEVVGSVLLGPAVFFARAPISFPEAMALAIAQGKASRRTTYEFAMMARGELILEEPYLYRGIPRGTQRHTEALNGLVRPSGTDVSFNAWERHVHGEDVASGVTSWTTDINVARQRFAGGSGTVLRVEAARARHRFMTRPNVGGKYADELERLIRGDIFGFEILP